jgi:hypothetical protein
MTQKKIAKMHKGEGNGKPLKTKDTPFVGFEAGIPGVFTHNSP